MKINKSECPILHFYYVGKVRRGYLLDKFAEIVNRKEENFLVDTYLVELIPEVENECEYIATGVNDVIKLSPRDITSIEDSFVVSKQKALGKIKFVHCLTDVNDDVDRLCFEKGKEYLLAEQTETTVVIVDKNDFRKVIQKSNKTLIDSFDFRGAL